MKIIIDSSVWLEYFVGGKKAGVITKYFKHPYKIFLPSIVLYEVYKKIKNERGEQTAVLIIAQMERMTEDVIVFDGSMATQAADISLKHKIPMADAIIYSSAIFSDATVITMDTHFKGLEQVQFIS